MIEFQIDLTSIETVLDLSLGQFEGAPFGLVSWSFTEEPSSGSCSIFKDKGDDYWEDVTTTLSSRVLTTGTTVIFSGPLDKLKVVLTGVSGGTGAVLRLWSFEQCPTLGFPQGVFSGTRALTTQSYTEANVKLGVQYENSTYNNAFPALGFSNIIVQTGDKDVVIKGRTIVMDGLGFKLELFVNPVYTGGTALSVYNLNHRNPVPTTVSIKIGSTVTSDGVKVASDKYAIGSEPQGGGSVTSSTTFTEAQGLEMVLSKNSVYHFKTTSLDPAIQTVFSYTTWYEGSTDLP